MKVADQKDEDPEWRMVAFYECTLTLRFCAISGSFETFCGISKQYLPFKNDYSPPDMFSFFNN
jgi:hypothetical protein